jgi:ATP-dependent Clp protease adaptor protein ClpS
MAQTKTFTSEDFETDILLDNDNGCQLIVWNDEVNSFDWVITTLIEICGHSTEQAEQSAMIIHTKGKYAVKSGSYDLLKPMCDSITERGIGATVEELSER